MRRETGIIEIFDPELPGAVQVPTFTCPHCGSVGRITSAMGRGMKVDGEPLLDPNIGHANDDGGWCMRCMAVICRKPSCGEHVGDPFFARMGFGY